MEAEKLFLFLSPLLYAETHYAFKWIFSRLKKREPEVIADIPARIEKDAEIPILIFFKDANLFPTHFNGIKFTIIKNGTPIYVKEILENILIHDKFWSHVYFFENSDNIYGEVSVNVEIKINSTYGLKVYNNDNYTISSHLPFNVFLASEKLPGKETVLWGDLHYHSYFTEDQVEFGAPLSATVLLAKAMGLNFFAATDHSYDLDDFKNNYLKNDPELKKWLHFQNEVRDLNKQNAPFLIIPGEEVSAGNARKKNIHFLILNSRKFYPGSGDGAEKWLHTKPELMIDQILDSLPASGLAYAAHSEVKPPWLQRLLLRRDKWHWADYLHPRLNGMQIWNGKDNVFFENGRKKWIRLLLTGKKLHIVAGNDAHGNFNRFRQIGFPFLTMKENNDEIFGKNKTGVIVKNNTKDANIIELLRKGHSIISNGPFLNIELLGDKGEEFGIGDVFTQMVAKLKITTETSHEYGNIKKIAIFYGKVGGNHEEIMLSLDDGENLMKHHQQIKEKNQFVNRGYIRGELLTEKNRRCFTNPIWIEPQNTNRV